MGDKIDILKIILDFLKGNKVLLLIVTSVLTSSAAGFVSGVRYNEQPVVVAPISTPAPTVTTIIKDCSSCKADTEKLKREVGKLKRWHGDD